MKLSRQQIIDGAIDLFGYGEDDFDGMGIADLRVYLSDEMPEIIQYYS